MKAPPDARRVRRSTIGFRLARQQHQRKQADTEELPSNGRHAANHALSRTTDRGVRVVGRKLRMVQEGPSAVTLIRRTGSPTLDPVAATDDRMGE
jgi:hypothetical protein